MSIRSKRKLSKTQGFDKSTKRRSNVQWRTSECIKVASGSLYVKIQGSETTYSTVQRGEKIIYMNVDEDSRGFR